MAGEHVHWLKNNKKSKYMTQCCLSFPLWCKAKDFQHLLDEARLLELETGIKHSLDHIIPITHRNVSGLSVPWNLRVISYSHNSAKGNKWN